MYATSNPATFYTKMEFSSQEQYTFRLVDNEYVVLDSLNIQGANDATVNLTRVKRVSVRNSKIGWGAAHAGLSS